MMESPDASNFSFRMFDLYRRFVEVLQLNSEYLADFKTGSPKEGICRLIIKQIFVLPQTEEKIKHLIGYLKKNAKLIAAHAENVPSNWNEAIKYSDTCVKVIRRYLKKKNINFNIDLNSIKELAKDISITLHKEPSERQVEAIREYLKYDLRNPKKNILLHVYKKSNKTQKSVATSEKAKNKNPLEIKKNNLKMVIKKSKNELLTVENINKTVDESSETISKESIVEKKCEIQTQSENQSREELSTVETGVSTQDSLQNKLIEIQKDLLHIDDTPKDPDKLSKTQDSNSLDQVVHLNECQDPRYVKLLMRRRVKHDDSEEYMIVAIDGKPGGESFEESKDLSSFSASTSISSTSSFDNSYNLKRKISTYNNTDDKNDVKKRLFNDSENVQENKFITISYENVNKSGEYEMMQIPVPLDVSVSSDNNDSSYYEINNVSIDNGTEEKDDNKNFKLENENLNNPSNSALIDTKYEKKISSPDSQEFKDWKEKYNEENNIKYASVLNMSYKDVLNLIETVLTFCELKDEISLEEFLILRRTRDKILWRSLKENKNFS